MRNQEALFDADLRAGVLRAAGARLALADLAALFLAATGLAPAFEAAGFAAPRGGVEAVAPVAVDDAGADLLPPE